MMKTIEILYTVLVLSALMLNLSSCGDDKEEYRYITDGGIFLKADTLHVPAAGGHFDLSAYSDRQVVFSIKEMADWMSMPEATRGMSACTSSLEVAANRHIGPRSGIVLVSSPDGSMTAELVVVQAPAVCDNEYHVEQAGSLASMVGEDKKVSLTSIKVTGNLNGDDLCFLREMAASKYSVNETAGNLKELDLSGASLVAGGGSYTNVGDMMENDNVLPVYAFYYSGLEYIILPENLETIDEYAFYEAYHLEHVGFPKHLKTINNEAFYCCYALEHIEIPACEVIDEYAFYECHVLKDVKIHSSLKTIGEDAFESCYLLHSVTLPEGVTAIHDYAFAYCYAMQDLHIPSTVTYFGEYPFLNCNLGQELTLSPAITELSKGVFYDANLTKIHLPAGLKKLNNELFCRSSLREIYIHSTEVPEIGDDVFYGMDYYNYKIYVLPELLEAYKTAETWKSYAGHIFPMPAE